MRKIAIIGLAVTAVLTFSGCATLRSEGGPSLYDNVVIVVTSENPLLIPQDLDKTFVQNVRGRLQKLSEANVASRGNMKSVPTCGPRAIKIASDIASLSVNSTSEYSGSFFRPRGTTTSKQDIRIALEISVEDCESGKVIKSFIKTEDGEDLLKIISNLSRDVGGAPYEHRYASRGK